MRKVVGADPLLISPILPLDFRMVGDKWVYEKDWWRNIPDKPRLSETKQEPRRGKRRK